MLLATFCVSFVLAWAGVAMVPAAGDAPPIWLAAGALLALVLRTRPGSWLVVTASGCAGIALANLIADVPLAVSAALAAANGIEVLLAAYALGRLIGPRGDIGRPENIGRYILVIAVAAVVAATLSTLALGLVLEKVSAAQWAIRTSAHFAGLAVLTPCLYLLSLYWPSVRNLAGPQAWPLALLVALAGGTFFQERYPFIYLVAVGLMFTAYRLRMVGASVGVLATLAIALAATLTDNGPFAMIDGAPSERILALQFFLVVCFYISVPIAVLRQRALVSSVLLDAAHAETSAAEAKYRRIAESIVDIIVQSDLEGRLVYVSPSCASLGLTPEGLIGRDSIEGLHPDDRARAAELRARLVFGGIEPAPGEWRFKVRTGSGEYRLLEGRPTVLRDESGEPLGIEAVYRDVTEAIAAQDAIAASEARYRLLAQNMSDIVACYGIDGLIRYISPSVEAVLGYRAEALVGRPIAAILHPDDLEPVRAQFAAARTAARPEAFRVECRIRREDGDYVWLEAHPQPVLDPETGAFQEWQDVIRDISERKAMEAELRAAKTQAEAAAQAKAEFLANMSHELRMPLASVLGFTKLAAEAQTLQEPARTYVERVRDASQSLIALVNDILELSKLEAGDVTFKPQKVDLSALARASLELFEPQAQEKGLALTLADRLPDGLRLELDPDRMRQVLLNLIGNAVKFTREGSVVVAIGYNADAAVLSVEVRDTGPGISAAAQEQLFKRFSRVGHGGQGGTGLGLAICKGIVEAMGGQIGVTSRVGEGSCFAFSAPAAVVETANDDDAGDGQGLQILVAGGSGDLAGQIRSLLKDRAEVTAVADGVAAVAQAWTRRFDLLLLDVTTPLAGGSEALQRIRGGDGASRGAPAIAIIDEAEREFAGSHLQAGFTGVMGEPVPAEELVSAIAHAMLIGRHADLAAEADDETEAFEDDAREDRAPETRAHA